MWKSGVGVGGGKGIGRGADLGWGERVLDQNSCERVCYF